MEKKENRTFEVEEKAKKSESQVFNYKTEEGKTPKSKNLQYVYDEKTDSYILQKEEGEP